MKNNNADEAARWLAQARHDLDVARWNAEGRFWSDACFMSQQAGEKALKAICIIARYPNGLPGLAPAEYFDEDEARRALSEAETIVELCAGKLGRGGP